MTPIRWTLPPREPVTPELDLIAKVIAAQMFGRHAGKGKDKVRMLLRQTVRRAVRAVYGRRILEEGKES